MLQWMKSIINSFK